MKTTSDDLFRLIKAMNKSEKGYFKKFASKNASGSKQNYIYLFEAIDSMDSYDENLLKKKLKDPSLLKQLAVYKVYLFNLVLKALNLYGAYDNSESQISEMLSYIRILTSKHLYREARKIIKKAKELAYKFDKHKFIMEILAAERHILILSPSKNAGEKREEIYRNQLELTERIREFYNYSLYCDRLTQIIDNEGEGHSDEKAALVEEIMNNDMMKPGAEIKGYYARMNYYHAHLVYSGSRGNTEDIFKYLRMQIEHDEANRHFIDENPQNYVYALINMLLQSHYANDHEETNKALAKLNTIKKKIKGRIPRETEIQILFHAANVEMLIFEKTLDMESGMKKIVQIESDLKLYGNEVPSHIRALMHVNIACFCIIDGEYAQALKHINTLLNTPELSIRSDVNRIVKLLELVLHYELKNFDLLEYLLVSAKKFFSPAKNGSIEQIMLQFFSAAIKKEQDLHKDMFGELAFKLKKAQDSRGLMNYLNFVLWAESHAEGKPLIDILRMQLNRQNQPKHEGNQ